MTKKFEPTDEWLHQKYVVEQLTLNEIARLCKRRRRTIRALLQKANVSIRSRKEAQLARRNRRERPSAEWLHQKYVMEKLTRREIQALCGFGTKTIRRLLKEANISIRSRSESARTRREREGRTILDNPDELRRLYVDEERSLKDISKMVGIGPNLLHRWIKTHGIPLRDPTEATNTPRYRKRRSGDKCHFWKGGITERKRVPGFTDSLKRQIRVRDNHQCVICGAKRKIRKLAVHHRNFDRDDHRSQNLVTLCHSCHAKVHGGSITLQD